MRINAELEAAVHSDGSLSVTFGLASIATVVLASDPDEVRASSWTIVLSPSEAARLISLKGDLVDERVLGRFTSAELKAELADRAESMRLVMCEKVREHCERRYLGAGFNGA